MSCRLDMTFTYDDGYVAERCTVTQPGTAAEAQRVRERRLKDQRRKFTRIPDGIEFVDPVGAAGPVAVRLVWTDVEAVPDE